MDWRKVLKAASQRLDAAGIDNAYREATYLWQAASLSGMEQWLVHEEPVSKDLAERFFALVDRRAHREPMAYILGTKEFYGLTLMISPDVLIPRPETEILVETILDSAKESRVQLVDVGTGSGAIALALKHERPRWHIRGVDISVAALQVARTNGERLGLAVEFTHSNLLSDVPHGQDVIAANLPYIDGLWDGAAMELGYEPKMALYAADHGLAVIRQLIDMAPLWLRPGGKIFLECGSEQAEKVRRQLARKGFNKIDVVQDYAGYDRVVTGQRSK